MSKLSEDVYSLIVQAFPFYKLWKEYYVNYKGTKLYFDFYLPELKIAFEAQGHQHKTFVEHFHKTAYNFRTHQKRDRLKKEWAFENGVVLIEYEEDTLPETVKEFLSDVFIEYDLQKE